MLAILERYTKVPAKTIQAATPHHQARDGKVILENLAEKGHWFVANGGMEQKIGVRQAVDLSFLR